MIHHRTPEFDRILKNVLEGLKPVFGTKQPVFIHPSTGSGGMESLLVNTLSPGDRVLCIVSGKFGERWAEMAQVFGLKVDTMNVTWGEAADPVKVEAHLKSTSDTRAVFCQACETSTAVLHPIRELAAVVQKFPQTLFLVDGITAVGALPLPMDEWGIDGLVAGSQKAFMLPTGMSFVSLSTKAWAAAEKSTMPKYYFDLKRERAANAKGETFFSSPVSLIRALEWVLGDIQQKRLSSLYHSIQRRAQATRLFASKIGVDTYAKAPSPSLTALVMPAGVDSQQVRLELESQYGVTVMGGQDQLKGRILRFGHMGHITDSDLIKSFESLAAALSEPARAAHFPGLKQAATALAETRKWLEANP